MDVQAFYEMREMSTESTDYHDVCILMATSTGVSDGKALLMASGGTFKLVS